MAILFALLGLLVGGLINQLGSDLPAFTMFPPADQGSPMSSALPGRRRLSRPHCPRCGQDRPWWQWLTLPASLIGRTRCPSCDTPIGLRHPLVEIGLAATYAYLWVRLGPSVTLVLYLVYSAIFALVLVTDIERRLILNVVMYPAILLAFVASFFTPGMMWWSALAGGAIGLAFFLGAAMVGSALFGSGALGGGDVKLAAFIGLITGFPLVIEALLLAMLLGAVVSLALLVTRVRSLRDPIPYGPFLVAGAAVTLLFGYPIAERFLY